MLKMAESASAVVVVPSYVSFYVDNRTGSRSHRTRHNNRSGDADAVRAVAVDASSALILLDM